jgi:hypothetical protein
LMQMGRTSHLLFKRICSMKIKDDIQDKWDQGWTIYDIAEHYSTPVENIMKILGIQENVFSYELH